MIFPDITTLKLCSVLASAAYGFVFLVLWLRNRRALHFAMWGASSLLYGIGVLCFALVPQPPLALASALCALLAVTNVLPVAGLLTMRREPPFRSWMIVSIVCAVAGRAVPSWFANGGMIANPDLWKTVGEALGLALSISIPGIVLAFGKGARDSIGQRMAGFAMLAYLPAYALSIPSAVLATGPIEFVPLFAMLSDQILLGVLNLGLLAIPVEQVQKELRMAALLDPLTGCWNRAGLASFASTHLRPRTMVVAIDVDHFKLINDRHGHAAGDEVLACIGRQARQLAGEYGAEVVRLGGDEFVIVVPPGRYTPLQLVTRLQSSLNGDRVGGRAWSVSLGVAHVRKEDAMLSEVIARADMALYQAKAARGPGPQRSAA